MPRTSNTCTYAFVTGKQCGSPALRGEDHCYYHLRYKEPQGLRSNTVPLLDDPDSIQLVVRDIMTGILGGTIEPRQASLLLYATQIASNNLSRAAKMSEYFDDFPAESKDERLRLFPKGLEGLTVCEGPDAGKSIKEVILRNMNEAGND